MIPLVKMGVPPGEVPGRSGSGPNRPFLSCDTPIFTSGIIERPLAIAAAPTALNAALQLNGFPANQAARDSDPRYMALQNLLLNDQSYTLIRGADDVTSTAISIEKVLRAAGNPTIAPFPLNPRTSLGNQLEQEPPK